MAPQSVSDDRLVRSGLCALLLPVCLIVHSVSRQLEKILDDRCEAMQMAAGIMIQPRAYPREAGSDGMLGNCIYSVSTLSSGSFPRVD